MFTNKKKPSALILIAMAATWKPEAGNKNLYHYEIMYLVEFDTKLFI